LPNPDDICRAHRIAYLAPASIRHGLVGVHRIGPDVVDAPASTTPTGKSTPKEKANAKAINSSAEDIYFLKSEIA